MAHLKLKIGVSRHQGMERDYQEDDFSVRPDLLQSKTVEIDWQQIAPSDWGTLLAVADGMGGMNAGEIASERAIQGVDDYFEQLPKNELPTNQGDLLCQSIYHANQYLVAYAKHHPESANMGTTMVLGWLFETAFYVAWSGDSRCYRLRQQQIQQLNHDHSYVQELIDKGKLTVEQAFYHPNKNVITQSLGDTSQHLKPEYKRYELQPNDRFLLCSDGLNTMLTDEQIGQILLEEADVMSCAKALVDAANAAGGHDNITVIVCDAVDAEVVASAPSLPHQETPKVRVITAAVKPPIFTNKNILMSFGVAALGILGFWGWKAMNSKKDAEAVIVTSQQSKKSDSVQNVDENVPTSPKLPISKPKPPESKPTAPKVNSPLPTPIPTESNSPSPHTEISPKSLDEILEELFQIGTLTPEQKGAQIDFRAKNKDACDCLKLFPEAKKIYDKHCNRGGSMIDVHGKSTDFYISLAASKDASSLEFDRNKLKKK